MQVEIGQSLNLKGKDYRIGRIDHHRYVKESTVSSEWWVKPEVSYIYASPAEIGAFRQGEVIIEEMDYLWLENQKDSLDTLFVVTKYKVGRPS